MHRISLPALLGAMFSVMLATPGQALNARTWISGKGSDAAGCGPVASPCRSLQFAHDQTSAGGEIDVLDPAGYGSLVITKAINVINEGVGVAGVLAGAGGNAITINAGNGDNVVLRGLTIEGAGAGANGIVFNSGAGMQVSNCLIQSFVGGDENHGNGILIKNTIGIPQITLVDTTISNNGWTGVLFRPTVGGTGYVLIEHVIATNNSFGFTVDSTHSAFGSFRPRVAIRNSVASNNSQVGFNFFATSSSYHIVVTSSFAANNGIGMSVNDTGGTTAVYLSRTTLINNLTVDLNGSGVVTFGNNEIDVQSGVGPANRSPY
jgi:hypothetical protein